MSCMKSSTDHFSGVSKMQWKWRLLDPIPSRVGHTFTLKPFLWKAFRNTLWLIIRIETLKASLASISLRGTPFTDLFSVSVAAISRSFGWILERIKSRVAALMWWCCSNRTMHRSSSSSRIACLGPILRIYTERDFERYSTYESNFIGKIVSFDGVSCTNHTVVEIDLCGSNLV